MEYENATRTRCLTSDIISTLPQNIIEYILSLMPLRDAVRTSVLSKKWQYCWRSMPKLVFRCNRVKVPSIDSNQLYRKLKKYKLVNTIFHVLLFHNGPTILKFNCSVGNLQMESEFAQIISYLAKGNTVKELIFINDNRSYKLPVSFFSFQGLEVILLENCTFEPLNGFSKMKCVTLVNVEVSASMLQRFLSNCPLLELISLNDCRKGIDSVAGGNKFTFVDLLPCVPLIQVLNIREYYMKYLCAGDMPHQLPTSLVHLKDLFLDVCLVELNEISSALCIIRSSPVLERIVFQMYDNDKLPVRQTPTNFLDPEDHSELKLDHLKTLVIEVFSNLPLEMEFVKLIMAKSPVLKKVRIEINDNVSVDEELKMLRDLVRFPFPRASPSADLIFVRP